MQRKFWCACKKFCFTVFVLNLITSCCGQSLGPVQFMMSCCNITLTSRIDPFISSYVFHWVIRKDGKEIELGAVGLDGRGNVQKALSMSNPYANKYTISNSPTVLNPINSPFTTILAISFNQSLCGVNFAIVASPLDSNTTLLCQSGTIFSSNDGVENTPHNECKCHSFIDYQSITQPTTTMQRSDVTITETMTSTMPTTKVPQPLTQTKTTAQASDVTITETMTSTMPSTKIPQPLTQTKATAQASDVTIIETTTSTKISQSLPQAKTTAQVSDVMITETMTSPMTTKKISNLPKTNKEKNNFCLDCWSTSFLVIVVLVIVYYTYYV